MIPYRRPTRTNESGCHPNTEMVATLGGAGLAGFFAGAVFMAVVVVVGG